MVRWGEDSEEKMKVGCWTLEVKRFKGKRFSSLVTKPQEPENLHRHLEGDGGNIWGEKFWFHSKKSVDVQRRRNDGGMKTKRLTGVLGMRGSWTEVRGTFEDNRMDSCTDVALRVLEKIREGPSVYRSRITRWLEAFPWLWFYLWLQRVETWEKPSKKNSDEDQNLWKYFWTLTETWSSKWKMESWWIPLCLSDVTLLVGVG